MREKEENKKSENTEKESQSDFLLYTAPDGEVKVDVFFQNETVWLTQAKMAKLFGVDRTVITKHVANIFDSGELEGNSNVQKMHVANSAKPVSYYDLDMIISVGYRVNSRQATQFRIWATKTLRNFIIKGYALAEDRFKNGSHFGKDYFDELLEKIREIRASERRFYKKITDIYATSVDYNKDAEMTKKFFATVQNKLHYGIHGQTASELIAEKVSAEKPHMGLETWKNAPSGKILKSDTAIGKNYLKKEQIEELNRIVAMYLDYAENQAKRGKAMKMAEWADRLDAFLQFNEYEILENPGKVSKETAEKLASDEYEKFRPIQDENYVSDFDEFEAEAEKLEQKRKDGEK